MMHALPTLSSYCLDSVSLLCKNALIMDRKTSQRIPLDEHTEEVRVRIADGRVELVLIGHDGSVESVPVRMEAEAAAERRAA